MSFETSGRNRRTGHNEENEQRDVGSGRKESSRPSLKNQTLHAKKVRQPNSINEVR